MTNKIFTVDRVTGCCLTPKWAICQLYHDENKLHSIRWWCSQLCNRPTRLVGIYSGRSLKQQSMGRHVAPLGNIILNPVIALIA